MPGNSPSDALVADGVCAVTTTVATPEDARRLAQAVLQQRLAACVQVEPITSHYRWQGALHEEAEWRLVCKTVAGSVAGLLQLVLFLPDTGVTGLHRRPPCPSRRHGGPARPLRRS